LEHLAESKPELVRRFLKGYEQAITNKKDLNTSYVDLDTTYAQEELGMKFRNWE